MCLNGFFFLELAVKVRDGSTLRVMLLPSFEYITLQLSGVRAPATRAGTDGKAELFSEEAKYFVEQRLLQQDVKVRLSVILGMQDVCVMGPFRSFWSRLRTRMWLDRSFTRRVT